MDARAGGGVMNKKIGIALCAWPFLLMLGVVANINLNMGIALIVLMLATASLVFGITMIVDSK